MHRSQYRAYRFAGCMLAMLTEHRLVHHGDAFHVIQITDIVFLRVGLAVLFNGVIPVDTYPVHFTAAAYFIAAYHWDIVFYITGYDTGATPCTCVEIDGHYPLVARLLVFVPQIVGFVRIGPPACI